MELDKTMEIGFSNLFLQYFQNIAILWKRTYFSSALITCSLNSFSLQYCKEQDRRTLVDLYYQDDQFLNSGNVYVQESYAEKVTPVYIFIEEWEWYNEKMESKTLVIGAYLHKSSLTAELKDWNSSFFGADQT